MSETVDYIDLVTLQRAVKEGLAEAFPEKVWVKAEIGQWAPRANGHCYLSLTQSRGMEVIAEARAVIWRTKYLQIKDFFETETGTPLGEGLSVLVRVQVSFHELYGYSLVIDDIDPAFTVGEKALERKRVIERLENEGYMEMQKELCLPPLPYRLAVVTSKTAAGYGDFKRHLTENAYGFRFHIDLFEALMQGQDAPASIAEALENVGDGYDAVLILRGGGSEVDLSCFDDYGLAVAIATCPTPVFTAIGHDRDHHVADMVAHRYVKTPTALADLFLDCYIAEDEGISVLAQRIRTAFVRKVEALQSGAEALKDRIKFALTMKAGDMEAKVALCEAKITANDPRSLLQRGYVLVTGPDGKLLKSARTTKKGDKIGIRFADGTIQAEVYGKV